MKKSLRIILYICLFLLSPALAARSASFPAGKVMIIPINGTIDPGMHNFVQRSLEEAKAAGIESVILELDTAGGYLESAYKIKKSIDSFPGKIYALVNKKATSAGAYLALLADEIYMVPGSTIGAAEPRLLGWGQVGEQTFSSWEKEMVGAAERRNRDPKVAAAMVRRDISISDLEEEGLLTLTAGEAWIAGYTEWIVENRAGLLQYLGLAFGEPVERVFTAGDHIARWTTNPLVATILLVVGIGCLVIELLSTGFGVAGLLSLCAFGFYFGGHILSGVTEYWVLFLFALGLILLLIEAFIPGFGVFGVGGLLATVASVVLAASSLASGLVMVAVSLVISAVLGVVMYKYFARRGVLRHLLLAGEGTADFGAAAPADRRYLLGEKGITLTPLRPSGSAEISGEKVDVTSEGGFIPAGATVKVVSAEGLTVVVRRLDGKMNGLSGNR